MTLSAQTKAMGINPYNSERYRETALKTLYISQHRQ